MGKHARLRVISASPSPIGTEPRRSALSAATEPHRLCECPTTMLELRHVSKRFGATLVVDAVSFVARAGEVTGYLGPNGSGKSTTLKMVTGLIDPTAGDIRFDGVSVRQALLAWKRRFGYVPEEPHLYGHLS